MKVLLALALLGVALCGDQTMCITSNYSVSFQYQKAAQYTTTATGDTGSFVNGKAVISRDARCVVANEYLHFNATYLEHFEYYAVGNQSYVVDPLSGKCNALGVSTFLFDCWDSQMGINARLGRTNTAIIFSQDIAGTQKTYRAVTGITHKPLFTNTWSILTFQTDTSNTSPYASTNSTSLIYTNFAATKTSQCTPLPAQCQGAALHPKAAKLRGRFEHLATNVLPGVTVKHELPACPAFKDPIRETPQFAAQLEEPEVPEVDTAGVQVCPASAFTTYYIGAANVAGLMGIMRYENANGTINARFDEEIVPSNDQMFVGTLFVLAGKQYWVVNGTCSPINVEVPVDCFKGVRDMETGLILGRLGKVYHNYYMRKSTPEFAPGYPLSTIVAEGHVPVMYLNYTFLTDPFNGRQYGQSSLALQYYNYTVGVDRSFFKLPSECNTTSNTSPTDTFKYSSLFRGAHRA